MFFEHSYLKRIVRAACFKQAALLLERVSKMLFEGRLILYGKQRTDPSGTGGA